MVIESFKKEGLRPFKKGQYSVQKSDLEAIRKEVEALAGVKAKKEVEAEIAARVAALEERMKVANANVEEERKSNPERYDIAA